MKPERLDQILQRGRELRVLVIGDLMLDEFIWGKVGRISPEAPVPVVEVSSESCYPGGAANVARNLRAFTSHIGVVGLLGDDRHGAQLTELLRKEAIDTQLCLCTPEFPTIVKTRIIARQQQVVRVDREKIAVPKKEQIASIVEKVRAVLPQIDALIFEDYGKGLVTQQLVSELAAAAQESGKILAADPNPRNPIDWRGFAVVKPNRSEAFHAAAMPPKEPAGSVAEDESLHQVGAALLAKWNSQLVLITLGEDGMILFQRKEAPHHVPTKARQVFDVSGAGDTAIALFTLALAAGASAIEAADIANHASAVVVGKLGTATLAPDELRRAFAHE